MRFSKAMAFLALWLVAATIAVFFAMLQLDSAFVDGEYIPRTNDSFYHARRILDMAVGSRGFYEFDERLHVPDGAWIPWPWAYDYLVAKALQLWLLVDGGVDPMRFLAYVPVVWLVVNTALFLAAVTALELSPGPRAVAMFAFALAPIVQLLHAVGMIDHHFIELTFTLLTVWLGLLWFRDVAGTKYAISLGVCLGIATAFHNGLFILQLPVLLCAFVLWVRGAFAPGRSALALCSSLIVSSLASSLPSTALRSGLFEFALLSWFHVYIAVCSAIVVGFMSLRIFTRGNLGLLAIMSILLALPILAEILRGARFFAGSISILDEISEAASPFAMFSSPSWGPVATASFYSWLLIAVPLLLVFFAWRVTRETDGRRLFVAVFSVFGLTLLLTQYRFGYFGLFSMIAAPLALLDWATARYEWRRGYAVVGALAVVLLTYQPALRGRLFVIYPPGGEADYAAAMPVFPILEESCAREGGLVLASSDDGNALLFHTDCSVIANNFIMRAEDEEKIAEARRLLRSTPNAILEHEPPISHVLLRATDFSSARAERGVVDASVDVRKTLLLDSVPPPGFKLVHTIEKAPRSARDSAIYLKLYEIERNRVAGAARTGD